MTVQLPLPAAWAATFSSRPDPIDELDQLARDKLDAKAETTSSRSTGEEASYLAARITGYIDDLLSDATYELERGLTHEIEARDGV